MADGQIIRFKIGEAFPADEPLARWVTVCAMALNDALLVNRWLMPRLQGEMSSEPHENFYLARVAAAHLFEAASFLRKYRRHTEISAFIETLEPGHQEQYAALLEIGKGDQEGFPKQLREARNTFFHYPKLVFGQEDREPLKRLRKVSMDSLKLIALQASHPDARFILAFADQTALKSLAGWQLAVLEHHKIERRVVEIPASLKQELLAAQANQKEGMAGGAGA